MTKRKFIIGRRPSQSGRFPRAYSGSGFYGRDCSITGLGSYVRSESGWGGGNYCYSGKWANGYSVNMRTSH